MKILSRAWSDTAYIYRNSQLNHSYRMMMRCTYALEYLNFPIEMNIFVIMIVWLCCLIQHNLFYPFRHESSDLPVVSCYFLVKSLTPLSSIQWLRFCRPLRDVCIWYDKINAFLWEKGGYWIQKSRIYRWHELSIL